MSEEHPEVEEVLDRLMGRKRCICGKKLPETDIVVCQECDFREKNSPGANQMLFGKGAYDYFIEGIKRE